jgi:hypothetical protein
MSGKIQAKNKDGIWMMFDMYMIVFFFWRIDLFVLGLM